MTTKYIISIQCLPECEQYEPGRRELDEVYTSGLAEAIRILEGYSKIKNHKVTLVINEEFDD